MNVSRPLAVWIVSVLLLPTASGCGSAAPRTESSGDGPIALTVDRAPAVGQRYHVVVRDQELVEQATSLDGQPLDRGTDHTTVRFEGTVEIKSVDAHGTVLERAFTVGHFEIDRGEGPTEVMPAGMVFFGVQQGAELTFLPSEPGQYQQELLKVLRKVASGDDPEAPTEAQMWALSGPVRVGASWELDRNLVAAGLGRSGQMRVVPDDVQAEATFVAVADHDGTRVAELRSTFDIARAEMALPDGATLDRTRLHGTLTDFIPLDAASLRVESRNALTLEAAFRVPSERGEVGVTMRVVSEHEALATPE